MILKFEDNVYKCYCSFLDKDTPKNAGFQWSKADRIWWTGSPLKANRLIKYADADCHQKLEAVAKFHQASFKLSKAKDLPDREFPIPEGKHYFPYQKAAILYATTRPNTLIADDMGVGKTCEIIGAINLLCSQGKGPSSILIICPCAAKIVWQQELLQWLTNPYRIGVARAGKPYPDADIVIINYELLHDRHSGNSALIPELVNKHFDLLICDEVQAIKGKTIRSKMVRAISATRKIAATGTPILNKPSELWAVLQLLAQKDWDNWQEFHMRYCGPKQSHWSKTGYDFSGSSNEEELQQILRSTIMIRRMKSEVLPDLPPKLRQVIEIPADEYRKVLAKEQKEIESIESKIAELYAQLDLAIVAEDEETYRSIMQALPQARATRFEEMARVRHDTAVAKLPAVIGHLKNLLESGITKIIVWAHHHDVLDAIISEFGNAAVKFSGKESDKSKVAALDRFLYDPTCYIFGGSIRSAGVAITIVNCSNQVFAELDWTPPIVTQAEDRSYRIGQHNPLLIQHIVLEGSIDATMAHRIIEKQIMIDKVLDKDVPPLEDIDIPIKPNIGSEKQNKLLALSGKLLPEDIQLAHNAIKIVAQECDHAHSIDMSGFNKVDANIGHTLAKLQSLSPKQGALALVVVWKYRNQLPETTRELLQDLYERIKQWIF